MSRSGKEKTQKKKDHEKGKTVNGRRKRGVK